MKYDEFCDCAFNSFIRTAWPKLFYENVCKKLIFKNEDRVELKKLKEIAKHLLKIEEINRKNAFKYFVGKDILTILKNYNKYKKATRNTNIDDILSIIEEKLDVKLDMYFVEKNPISKSKNFGACVLGKYWVKYGIKPGVYINNRFKNRLLCLSWILLHESIHHALSKKYKSARPSWFCHYFEEGFADFFASYEFAEIFGKELIRNHLYNRLNWEGRCNKDEIYYCTYFKLCVLLYLEGGEEWYNKMLNNLKILRSSSKNWLKEKTSFSRGKYYDLFREIITWNRLIEDPLILYLYERFNKDLSSGVSISSFCKDFNINKNEFIEASKNSGLVAINNNIVVLRYLSMQEIRIIKYLTSPFVNYFSNHNYYNEN